MSKPVVQSRSTVRPLDRNGFIPLYFQIQRALRENIHSGELSEGDALASEEELARTYQVSRTTVRQALHGLKTSGYACSQKGRGTFVTRPKLEKNIMHLMGFTEDMKQRGMVPSSRVLEQSSKVFSGARQDQLFEAVALPHSSGKLWRSSGVGRRGDRGGACHTRRVGAVYDSKESQCVIDLADHHDYGGDADRGCLLAVSWRPLSCFNSRPDYNDRIASSAFTRGLA